MTAHTDVLVIGGGYAGVMAANRLTQRDDLTVTLINPRPSFVERIRLHQLVGRTGDAVVDYRDVLAEDIELVVDSVTRIDAAERSVALASGGVVGYDYLIYAVGSGSADPQVPGAAEFAYPLATLEAAQQLRTILDTTPATDSITVVGAGPTGIETAAELAELGRTVTLVCGAMLGPYLHTRGRRSVAKRLTALGVTVLDGPNAEVTGVTADTVRLSGGHTLRSDLTIWTAGFGVPDLAARSGLSTNAAGRLLTDETLTSIDDPHIVAAGDSAAPSDMPLRMSCQAAIPLGARAADTVLSHIDGEQPATLNQAFAGQCISLGRKAGIFQFAHRYDVAVWLHIGGRPGATIKEYICRGIVGQLAEEAHKPGSYRLHRVSGGGKRRQLLEAKRRRTPTEAQPAA
ncbi:FAD-dependent oxidoreductase [Nocardia cyriacigeorgica]|uniref:FAD-dependent oxidoreductase n=1 Tax=Nocardia cyriacigeorgica TaxID=135487 RepID=A0A6P1DHC5_9NOCA|nr:FAD-dependent oxidoreductase [Nocardia cyriacigeorgica]NEW37870.1 FAD-dependent oxidoreductase [Nocardia cyriacigeorgica]NEW47983.1 FAD-dependent oxidoreductase [Nocardia cyriacigeorgica]NEW48746.1 FAD-dependent oxidoreductase [Nocardia cyriacigeorgica]NEW58248.1 FAD-dependent oxidoreductase [Nocardia cyriacigeorgica]